MDIESLERVEGNMFEAYCAGVLTMDMYLHIIWLLDNEHYYLEG